MSGTLTVDICVCTFRRPQLAETLTSLAALEWPARCRGRIIVIDNDDAPSAEPIVREFAKGAPVPIRYIHRPGRNISLARNAALEESDSDLLAFLDDDETASPGWIASLLQTLDDTSAQAVLGPVRAIYAEGTPEWMQVGEVHATRPVWVAGEIRTGYTCNVLIDRRPAKIRALRFDPALGRSGGEDSAYFSALTADGGRITYSPDAWLSEPVPDDRATLGWLLKRRWRMGLTHARGLAEGKGGIGRAGVALVAAAKAAVCGLGALATAPSALRRNRFLMRGTLHLGVVRGTLGGKMPVLYGQPAERAAPDA